MEGQLIEVRGMAEAIQGAKGSFPLRMRSNAVTSVATGAGNRMAFRMFASLET